MPFGNFVGMSCSCDVSSSPTSLATGASTTAASRDKIKTLLP